MLYMGFWLGPQEMNVKCRKNHELRKLQLGLYCV
jgi:hypothetical protein